MNELAKGLLSDKNCDKYPTTLAHIKEPHCCGCFTLVIDHKTLNDYHSYEVWAICNECSQTTHVGTVQEWLDEEIEGG